MSEDRLTGLDESFLHLESDSAHMHVAGLMLLSGEPPAYDELLEGIEARLHLVPRYRQRLAFVPYGQGRPRWVDDPHLNLSYHVRATALPAPGSEEQLRALAGRVFSQGLDRDKPLWEMWIVHGVEGGRFAVLSKTHHALVDGVSGVDIVSVLFDTKPEPDAPPDPGRAWLARPLPSGPQLLAEALVERVTRPAGLAASAVSLMRRPMEAVSAAGAAVSGLAAMVGTTLRPAPTTPYNQSIGPHRRFAWVRCSLADVKAVKDELGGTVNDVMVATVAGALRRHLRRRGVATDGLELKAMIPVSVRSDDARGALGNQVAAMMATLPVGVGDPVARLTAVSEEMRDAKGGGQAVGARVLTELTGFAPPTIMSQAARLAAVQRVFNLVITNIPGPQFPLYLHGRELLDLMPMVPLAQNQALGVAIMSYNGRISFGLNADYDALPDLDDLALDVRGSLDELAAAAGLDVDAELSVERAGALRA
ncbi:MAG: wax ester/triacylglycerol synthase family O-acyltransferase [Thermoleophilaceae bacterium]|nr:wax ester/triacylglycerol synthase family O-acyltransferase [Thermoleophilaceae bacterium]